MSPDAGDGAQPEAVADADSRPNGNAETQFAQSAPNPLDSLNFEADECKEAVEQLAAHLKVPVHPNHLITLKAICKLVQHKYATQPEQLATKPAKLSKAAPMNLAELNLGIPTDDKVLERAMKAMRLLYIDDVRALQTKINTTIVSAQTITANPKTDASLGQVGRG